MLSLGFWLWLPSVLWLRLASWPTGEVPKAASGIQSSDANEQSAEENQKPAKITLEEQDMSSISRHPETLALHGGWRADPATNAVAVPIYQTTSYQFRDTEHASNLFALRSWEHLYAHHEPHERHPRKAHH